MIQIDNDPRDFRGTVWDRTGGPMGPFKKFPDVRFVYLDEDHPRCPTHIWWDGLCLRLDRRVAFQEGPEHDARWESNQLVQLLLGRMVGLLDPEYMNLTLDQVLALEQDVQERAKEKYRDPSDRRRRDRRKLSW